jgi:hypothetical protein
MKQAVKILQVETSFQDEAAEQAIGAHLHLEHGNRSTLEGRQILARSR